MGEGQDEPREQDPALEEIRRLFARYRQPKKRFGRVAEREEPPDEHEQDEAPPSGRDARGER
jgi:hypothetical protein